jgi:hypothetical protein
MEPPVVTSTHRVWPPKEICDPVASTALYVKSEKPLPNLPLDPTTLWIHEKFVADDGKL